MSKIFNTLKKGTGKAKLVVILAILAGIASLGFIVLAIVLKQLLYFFGTVICAFITISLKQTLDVYEYQGMLYADGTVPGNAETEAKPESETEIQPEGDNGNSGSEVESSEEADVPARSMYSADNDGDGEETVGDDIAEQDENQELSDNTEEYNEEDVASLFDKMNNLLDAADAGYEDTDMDELAEIIAESEEEIEAFHTHKHVRKKKKHKGKKSKQTKSDEENSELKKSEKKKRRDKKAKSEDKSVKSPDKGVIQEEILEDELEKDLKFLKRNISGDYGDEDEDSKKLVVVKQASDEVVATYDRKKIKRTMHKYKVKKDHRLVLIDHCDKYYIKQTPAYIWVSDKEFNILLIEEEPRHLVLPLYGIKEITYLKKCPVNADTDYPIFHKKTLLTDTFRPYLPDYTQSTVVTDLTSYKNLYGFGPGIYCTNRSAKNLFDLLPVEFRVDDKVTMSNKVNIYFKECYKAGILLRDNVIDANGYADMISRSLDDMAKSTVSNNEFKDTLNLLVRNKIITKEFSNHYMDVRNNMVRS